MNKTFTLTDSRAILLSDTEQGLRCQRVNRPAYSSDSSPSALTGGWSAMWPQSAAMCVRSCQLHHYWQLLSILKVETNQRAMCVRQQWHFIYATCWPRKPQKKTCLYFEVLWMRALVSNIQQQKNTYFFSYCPLLQHLYSPSLFFKASCLKKPSLPWLVSSHRPEQEPPTMFTSQSCSRV